MRRTRVKPFADYIYRNADDSLRLRVFLNDAGWDYDVFKRAGGAFDHNFSSDAGDIFTSKREAIAYATRHFGKLVSLGALPTVDHGWPVDNP